MINQLGRSSFIQNNPYVSNTFYIYVGLWATWDLKRKKKKKEADSLKCRGLQLNAKTEVQRNTGPQTPSVKKDPGRCSRGQDRLDGGQDEVRTGVMKGVGALTRS